MSRIRYLSLGLLVWILGMCCSCSLCFASEITSSWNGESVLKDANEAYKKNDFKLAFDNYQKASHFITSSDLYFNMGNAAFKQNQLGLAIVNYERARRLTPRDPDIIENLKYARSLVEYRVEDKRNFLIKQVDDFLDLLSLRDCLLALLASYGLMMIVWLAQFILRRPVAQSSLFTIFAVLFALMLVPAMIKFYDTRLQHQAVVTKPKADARFGPSTTNQLAFRVVEGIEVTVLDESGEWSRIMLQNGESGWVPKEVITVI